MTPLVQTYGTVPYRDLDPTVPAGLAYVFMFGMMFGDAGHGALLVLAALLLSGPAAPVRPLPSGVAVPARRRPRGLRLRGAVR